MEPSGRDRPGKEAQKRGSKKDPENLPEPKFSLLCHCLPTLLPVCLPWFFTPPLPSTPAVVALTGQREHHKGAPLPSSLRGRRLLL